MISLGGALGGLSVGLAAPYLLPGYFELAIGSSRARCSFVRSVRIAWWAALASVPWSVQRRGAPARRSSTK